MTVIYNRDGAIALYNQALQNGRYTIAYGFHHMLRQGDHPGPIYNFGELSQQSAWVH